MPYRPPSPRQRDAQARKLATMRAGRDRARMASPAPDYPPPLPELRRVVTITDYDTGEPVTHELRLLRSRRVDSYRVIVDGQPWHRAGWTAVLAMLRRAYPRVPSPRSDFWSST